jgi:hypothetical protein
MVCVSSRRHRNSNWPSEVVSTRGHSRGRDALCVSSPTRTLCLRNGRAVPAIVNFPPRLCLTGCFVGFIVGLLSGPTEIARSVQFYLTGFSSGEGSQIIDGNTCEPFFIVKS